VTEHPVQYLQHLLGEGLLGDVVLDRREVGDLPTVVGHRNDRQLYLVQLPGLGPVGELSLPDLPGLDRLPQCGRSLLRDPLELRRHGLAVSGVDEVAAIHSLNAGGTDILLLCLV